MGVAVTAHRLGDGTHLWTDPLLIHAEDGCEGRAALGRVEVTRCEQVFHLFHAAVEAGPEDRLLSVEAESLSEIVGHTTLRLAGGRSSVAWPVPTGAPLTVLGLGSE